MRRRLLIAALIAVLALSAGGVAVFRTPDGAALRDAQADTRRSAQTEALRDAPAATQRAAQTAALRQAQRETLRKAQTETLRQAQTETLRQAQTETLRKAQTKTLPDTAATSPDWTAIRRLLAASYVELLAAVATPT